MLAITGGKGGCGKTTTTLGLARALANQGFEPLVVDGDCDMPDIHHRLMLEDDAGVDAVAAGRPLTDVVQRTERMPGVAVVPGGRRHNLNTALGQTAHWHGPVLVDCGAGATPDSLTPLRHATGTVVVSTDTAACIDDTRRTLTAARELGASPVGIIVRTTGSAMDCSQQFDAPVLGSMPSVVSPLDHMVVERTLSSISRLLFKQHQFDWLANAGLQGLNSANSCCDNH